MVPHGNYRLTSREYRLIDHIFDYENGSQYVVGGRGSVYRLMELSFLRVRADFGEEAKEAGAVVPDELTFEEINEGCDMRHMQRVVVEYLDQPAYPYLTTCSRLYESLYSSSRRVLLGVYRDSDDSGSSWEDEGKV
jgi:hypothetical protein